MERLTKVLIIPLVIQPILAAAEDRQVILYKPQGSAILPPQYYVGLNIGYISPAKLEGTGYEIHKKPKDSNSYGLAMGYYINDRARLELGFTQFNPMKYRADFDEKHELGMQIKSSHKQKVQSSLIGINLYFNVINTQSFTGYLTGGVGLSHNKAGNYHVTYTSPAVLAQLNHTIEGKSMDNMAWNIGTGIAYKLDNRVVFDLINFKYHDLGKLKTSGSLSIRRNAKLRIFSITTGVRVNFAT